VDFSDCDILSQCFIINDMSTIKWRQLEDIEGRTYTCGHCGKIVGPNKGYLSEVASLRIYICSFCNKPTYFEGDDQTPGVAYGSEVDHLPGDVAGLYREARNCMSVSSYTAAVLTCRKLLMNIAVAQGAAADQPFITYVEYLASNGYVPPHGKGWVDHIRKRGNEATHEIRLMSKTDAEELITFIEMLLKFIYEFPSRIPPATP
jgi:hypothetical protein